MADEPILCWQHLPLALNVTISLLPNQLLLSVLRTLLALL
jgi:hypothetical protein